MDFNAFSEGVKPGGLKTKNDIKLLICYVLASVKQGLTKDDIVSVLQKNGIANYFETVDALSDLIKNNNISCIDESSGSYNVTDSGKMISEQLEASLPVTIREQALAASLNLLAKIKREKENKATIKKTDNGYNLECHISGGDYDLMSIKLYAPDLLQARLAKKNFQNSPEVFYSCLLALMTNNKDILKDILGSV